MVCCDHGVKKSLMQLSNWRQQNRNNLNILLRRFSEAACVKHTSESRILKGLRFYPTDKFYPTKLACCSFTDASKRHKTPGSEMNDFITHSLVVARGSVMMLVAWALLPMRRSPDSQVEPAHAVDLLQDEFWSQGTPKQTCSFGVVETISVSSKDFRYINILEKRVQNKGSQGICLQDH